MGSDRTKVGIYHNPDLESKSNNFRIDGDDEIELLHQQGIRAPETSHQLPPVFVVTDNADFKSAKQLSRDNSLESGVTGPR